MRLVRACAPSLFLLVILAGCASPDDPAGTPTPPQAASSTPTPTEDPSPTALPADCAALVAHADPAQFGDAPLNPEGFSSAGPSGVVTPSEPPAGATPVQTILARAELECLWRNPAADVTYLGVWAGHVTVDVSETMIAALSDEGYLCEAANGGTLCWITTPNPQYPVDDGFTYQFRDDVVLYVGQSNVVTNDLMGSMTTAIWG